MNIEKLPTLSAKDFGFLEDPKRPILSLDWTADGPHRLEPHQHPRAQIIYQCSGVYRINTPQGNFVVPPQQAIWIPSHLLHESFTHDTARALMFFVDGSFTSTLCHQCMVVNVTPLLKELFLRIVRYGNDYQPTGKEARLVQVMLDELSELTPAPLKLPLAKDKRLRRAMDLLLEDPVTDLSLDSIASLVGASGRTLARLFRSETGLSFVEWRNQLLLMEAIDRIGQGQLVTRVALDLGYRNPSAFIAMFKRSLGASPVKYLRSQQAALKLAGSG